MKHYPRRPAVGAVLLLASVWPGGASASPAQFGLPERLEALASLDTLSARGSLTSAQKTETLIHWLIAEREHPREGGTADRASSANVETRIIRSLAANGSIAVLQKVVGSLGAKAWDSRTNPSVRDAAALALGMMGDRGRRLDMERILREHPWSDYRALAAEALGAMGEPESVPALKAAAASDPFRRARQSGAEATDSTPAANITYPVREAAEAAIRRLTSSASLTEAQSRWARLTPAIVESVRNADQVTLSPWFAKEIAGAIPPPDRRREKRTVAEPPNTLAPKPPATKRVGLPIPGDYVSRYGDENTGGDAIGQVLMNRNASREQVSMALDAATYYGHPGASALFTFAVRQIPGRPPGPNARTPDPSWHLPVAEAMAKVPDSGNGWALMWFVRNGASAALRAKALDAMGVMVSNASYDIPDPNRPGESIHISSATADQGWRSLGESMTVSQRDGFKRLVLETQADASTPEEVRKAADRLMWWITACEERDRKALETMGALTDGQQPPDDATGYGGFGTPPS